MSEDSTFQQAGQLYTDQRSGALRARRYRVQVVVGDDAGRAKELEAGTFLIGSHTSCDLQLTDKGVSRYHVELTFEPGGLKITDLDSTNGTFMGGTRIGTITLVDAAPQTRLRLGTHTELEIVPADVAVPVAGWTGDSFGRALGSSKPMRALFGLLAKISPTDSTILLEGETGTGKELLAEAIHQHSSRKDGPYIVVDCGSLPKELIGSELFGHVRGAFTGAVANKRGLIESANGGTLFLDEIGELPLELQPQLLRVLEKREVRPIGELRSRKVDIRVVAATHRGLTEMVKGGTFREDLYFRLAVVRLEVPPLRKHKEDLPQLVRAFVQAHGGAELSLSPQMLEQLTAHDWPGNVRELRNVVERGVSLESGALDLHPGEPQMTPGAPAPQGLSQELLDMSFKDAKSLLTESFEREYLTHLLKRHNGNISRAAHEAGIDRNYIHRLVKKYGIPVDRG